MYNIQAHLPSTLAIVLKCNISGLTGEVISSCYYLSIEDYLRLNMTINGVVDTVNLIDYHYTNLDFSTVSGLNAGISLIISSLYVCITLLNGVPIISSHEQNINVLDCFTINGQKYLPNEENRGNIELPDRYIPGKPEDYVQSFNGRSGDVNGAILQVVVNEEIRLMNDGLINLDDLTRIGTHVSRVNLKTLSIQLLTQIQYGEDLVLSATSTNLGKVRIESNYFKVNNSNRIGRTIGLNNVNESNLKTAFTKEYLDTYIANVANELIKWELVTGDVITLPEGWYPLHFYSGVNWVKDVTWVKDGNNYTLINNSGEILTSYSYMKVTN